MSFVWPVRVYYEDTDSGGVVYYANYLKFMERARTEWLRSHGFEQTDLAEQHGIVFVVRAVSAEYLRPARFNDALEVLVEPKQLGRSQLFVDHVIRRGEEILNTAQVRLACVNAETFRPEAMPEEVRTALLQGREN